MTLIYTDEICPNYRYQFESMDSVSQAYLVVSIQTIPAFSFRVIQRFS